MFDPTFLTAAPCDSVSACHAAKTACMEVTEHLDLKANRVHKALKARLVR